MNGALVTVVEKMTTDVLKLKELDDALVDELVMTFLLVFTVLRLTAS